MTHVSEINDSGISVGGVVAAGRWTQRHPKRLAYTKRPDSGPRRAPIGRIVKWIARNAIAGFRINAKNFSGKRIDHLGSESANVLRRPDDAFAERLLVIGNGIASVVAHVCAFTAGGKQCPIVPKHKRI